MRKNEVRALTQAGVLLLAVSGFRVAWDHLRRLPDEPLNATLVDGLIAASDSAATDVEVRSAPIEPGERIDPNVAGEAELDRLPGIGPALARRIVAARADGPFREPSDLARVAGIGPKKLEQIRDKLSFTRGPSTRPQRQPPNRPPRPSHPNLGSMSMDELQALDGIGPTLAARIVEFRDKRGGISGLEALLAVPGIGPSTLERMAHSLDRMSGRR